MYQLQIIDIDCFDNKYYYRLRITTNQSSCYRDVRVRLQDLNQMARNLAADNYNHNFPPFPEKSLFSSWFQSGESKEELQEFQKGVQAYLTGISKNIPMRCDALNLFVCSTYDPQRSKDLKFQGISKEILYKNFVKTATIKKGQFNKVFRVSAEKQVYVVHQFLMPQGNEVAKVEFENYKRYQQLITDHTHIVRCYEIGQIIKKKPFFNKKSKKTIYNAMKIPNDAQYDVFYAIEEFTQHPMNEIITLRQQTQQYFDLELLTEAMIALVNVAQYFQFLQINSKQFSVSNFYYDERKGFKVGGLSPIYGYKKKYRLKFEVDPNEYQSLNPPEQSIEYQYVDGQAGNYMQKYPNNKTDSWQIGIILLSMASLSLPYELITAEAINDKLNIVQIQYGETLAILIKGMVERSPYDRSTLTDISNASQLILPMKLSYLLKEDIKIERLKIHIAQPLEEIDKYFKERTKKQYIVQLTLDNSIIQQMFLLFLERIKRENVKQVFLYIPPQELQDELIDKMMKILIEYKQLHIMVLNLRKCKISDQACKNIITQAHQINSLRHLTLDLSEVKGVQIPQTQQFRLVVYNQ